MAEMSQYELYALQDRVRGENMLRRAQAAALRQQASTAAFAAQTERERFNRQVFNENADFFDPFGRTNTLTEAARAGIEQTRAGVEQARAGTAQTQAGTEQQRFMTDLARRLSAAVPGAGQEVDPETAVPRPVAPTPPAPPLGMSVRPVSASEPMAFSSGEPQTPQPLRRAVPPPAPGLGLGMAPPVIGQTFGMGALSLPQAAPRTGGFEYDPETGAYTLRGRGRVPENDTRSGYTPRYAKGTARVPGKGDGTKDTVKAKLAPGEAVLNKSAANTLGRGLIQRLNAHGATKMGMV